MIFLDPDPRLADDDEDERPYGIAGELDEDLTLPAWDDDLTQGEDDDDE